MVDGDMGSVMVVSIVLRRVILSSTEIDVVQGACLLVLVLLLVHVCTVDIILSVKHRRS